MCIRKPEQLSEGTAGGVITPDIGNLSLDPEGERRTSPSSGKKRRAETDFDARRGKVPTHVEVVDPDFSRNILLSNTPDNARTKPHDPRLFDHKHAARSIKSPRKTTPDRAIEQLIGHRKDTLNRSSPNRKQRSTDAEPLAASSRQPGLIELQKYDPRYPGLLLQPDSRPISQEQLASEVKSIYAGLTMVETKCIHVDRAQAAAVGDSTQDLAPDHWQALIALHRTLLHEHHDFFLASQHPSASPALRRLAAKYTMPARMWKHGIHSFLELLRQRLPKSLDYMLAFIYLAYQMMALLYETVPAFEDTWIECLGDLGRYRMAIEDEDIRDRETWASVARSWYSKAADKNPTVGRLSHHLAILARPNALQQVYYYSRSLNAVEPFPSARESIMTLFDPLIKRKDFPLTLPVDSSFIEAHAQAFVRGPDERFDVPSKDFLGQLDNHVGRVTAKWKEQGVYTAVTNLAGWFDYGVNLNVLRQLFLLRAEQRKEANYIVEQLDPNVAPERQDLQKPRFSEQDLITKLKTNEADTTFCRATKLTTETFALVLRRIGDKNVLPHVHVMLSFLTTFAAVDCISHLIDQSPWADIVAFLNTLIKTENQQNPGGDVNESLTKPVFTADGEKTSQDDTPLPEDYLIRGLIWAQEYLPAQWFDKEHDEEERYLELASTARRRSERVLRLGYRLATVSSSRCNSNMTLTWLSVRPLDLIQQRHTYVCSYILNCFLRSIELFHTTFSRSVVRCPTGTSASMHIQVALHVRSSERQRLKFIGHGSKVASSWQDAVREARQWREDLHQTTIGNIGGQRALTTVTSRRPAWKVLKCTQIKHNTNRR